MTAVVDQTASVQEAPEVAPGTGRRRVLWVGLGVGVLVLVAGLAVPHLVADPYTMSLLLDATLLSLMAVGIGFLARHLGLISLGHVAFFGSAAYAVGVATTNWGWSPTAAVLFGVLVGTVIALLIGVLVVRASGFGFLMLTLALSQALYSLAVQTSARPWTGAHDGKLLVTDPEATFLGLSQADVMNPGTFWPLAWVVLVVAVTGFWALGRTRFGTTLEGIRENEERMRFSGYDTFVPRLVAFVASGAVAAVGGALYALNAGYVSPDILGFGKAGDALIAVLVGGAATVLGPVLGVFLFVWAQANFNFGGNLHLFTGLALIAVLVFLPGGITGTAATLVRRIRKGRR